MITRLIRPQDLVWLALFSALAWASPHRRTPIEIVLLLCLGAFQVAEPRVRYFVSERGLVAGILIKLVLCYLLIGWTGGINSSYYLALLLPVVSAATTVRLPGTLLVIAASILSYLSFLMFVDWQAAEFDTYGARELVLRVLFFPALGFLTWQLAEANRAEARKSHAVAEQLAEANRSLHEAEAAVRRSDRLAALGQLTAGLAHELRNPLGTIRASAEMLEKSVVPGNGTQAELAGFIVTEVDRTNSLITRFLEFARPVKLRTDAAAVGEVIDRAVEQLARHNPKFDVVVYRNYAPDIPSIQMDAELMERVFYNLVLNAAQATPAGGAITVKTRAAREGAEISVIDTGAGIDARDLENIFNPFFTTKRDGVGLGLAIVSKIVDEHGGNIRVESEAGHGSVFRVYLPFAPAAGGRGA